MEKGNIQIVVNPTAGSGKAKKSAETLIQKIADYYGGEVTLTFTEKKNDAKFITRKAIEKGANMIIVCGGDGTVNEVVNGFFLEGKPLNHSCELGVVNCGTGGGYARSLKSPKSTGLQIEQLLKNGSVAMDLGSITYLDSNGNKKNRLFANECQVGIGSRVAEAVGKKSKLLGGTIAFGFAATVFALYMEPLELEIKYDDDAYEQIKLIGLVVGNGTECAGGMKLTPDAKLTDGYFDVLTINDMHVFHRMMNLSKVYSGKHILSPYFSIRRCKKLQIGSDIGVKLESDGELLGNSPFTIELLPAAIRVRTTNINI